VPRWLGSSGLALISTGDKFAMHEHTPTPLLPRRLCLARMGRLGLASALVVAGCSSGQGGRAASDGQVLHEDADLPRQVPSPRSYPMAWVLSSGGPRGFVHVGVLKALHQLGLKPDLVVGSSVGALVGCLVAAGVDMAQMESLALEASMGSLFRLNLLGEGWISGAGLADLVNSLLDGKRLQQLPTDFAAVALAQQSEQLTAFNWGNAGLAVQAACAVEGRLAPVDIAGQRYVDADRLSPLPVRLAHALGAQRVLAIDASAHEQLAPASAERFRESDARKRAMTRPDAALAQLVLHPDIGYYTSVSRPYRERAIQVGYESTLGQADSLRALHQQP